MKTIGNIILTILGVFVLIIVFSYFTHGHGNPEVKAEHDLRDQKVMEYCKDMQSYGMFKNRMQDCIDQNKRAWDGSSLMRKEIMKGYSE